MIVIKLGGSLLASGWLLPCLDKVDRGYQGQSVVIVPGGGDFAEQVRLAQQQWQFDDRTAHKMAILAMQQMALLIHAVKPACYIATSLADLRQQNIGQQIMVWSPDIRDLDAANIASSWAITSDSLSAWLAAALNADELVVVKSVRIASDFTVQKLIDAQVVDRSFHAYTQQATFKLSVVNAETFIS